MIRRSAGGALVALAIVTGAVLGCTARGGAERDASGRSSAASSDPDRPLQGLDLDADAVAARLGSFAWTGDVTWSVEKAGVAPIHAVERHRVRQLASGDFDASLEIDPGGGPGSETGRRVTSKGGMVYAHGRWSPYRERPTDRGEGARRFRDESFRIAADVADLLGPALVAQPAGATTVLGRSGRRFTLSFRPANLSAPAAVPGASQDPDTALRRAFLDGRVPTWAEGELVVDATTGVPLAIALRASFTGTGDAQLKAAISVDARVTGLGHDVAAVHAPKGALPDDRKPKGVARALEASGLRQRGPAAGAEPEEEVPDESP
jgi:hypothetical protein